MARFWVKMAALVGGLGLIMLGAALLKDCSCALPLAGLGAVHLAVAAYALRQHMLAALAYPFSREARERARRGELATLLLAAPYAVLGLCLAVFIGAPATQRVSGKPVEVRSWSRIVVMPGGQAFTYNCWKGWKSGSCPGDARWEQLPRWPAPDHVEMQVVGGAIRSLTMDGMVIVDSAEARTGDRVGRVFGLAGGAVLTVLTMRGIARRVRPVA